MSRTRDNGGWLEYVEGVGTTWTPDWRIVRFECRDIGYGVEEGVVRGYWTDDKDPVGAGKRHLITTDKYSGRNDMWLFDDEIVSDAPDNG